MDFHANRKSIQRGLDDDRLFCPGLSDNFFVGLGSQTENQHLCALLQGTDLIFHPVHHEHQISRLDVLLHALHHGRTHQYLAFFKAVVAIAHHDGTVHGICNIPVPRLHARQEPTVLRLHKGLGDVSLGDQSDDPVLFCHRKCHRIRLCHEIPCLLDGHVLGRPGRAANFHVTYLSTDVAQVIRDRHVEAVQHVHGLLADFSRPHRNVVVTVGGHVFQMCICDSGADGIRIRILMSNYDDVSFLLHTALSFFSCRPRPYFMRMLLIF